MRHSASLPWRNGGCFFIFLKHHPQWFIAGEFYEFNLKYAGLFIYSFRPYFRHCSARSRANRRQSARGAIPAAWHHASAASIQNPRISRLTALCPARCQRQTGPFREQCMHSVIFISLIRQRYCVKYPGGVTFPVRNYSSGLLCSWRLFFIAPPEWNAVQPLFGSGGGFSPGVLLHTLLPPEKYTP